MHVNSAIQHFLELEHLAVNAQVDPAALGVVAQRAKRFLSTFVGMPQISDVQKDAIQKIIWLIDTGKYANLPSDVDRLQKKKFNLDKALAEVDKVAKEYQVENTEIQKVKKGKVEKPVLIITESFE